VLARWPQEAEENDESAAWIIAAGFTLLRYTGHIDSANRRLLVKVLQQQADQQADHV